MSLAGQDPDNNHLRDQATEHFRRFLQLYPDSYRVTFINAQLARLSLLAAPAQ